MLFYTLLLVYCCIVHFSNSVCICVGIYGFRSNFPFYLNLICSLENNSDIIATTVCCGLKNSTKNMGGHVYYTHTKGYGDFQL